MPVKIEYAKKEEWFEAFEQGATVASLASSHKKDPRTIQRGIEEVRHRRLANEVRTGLLREGLRRHQEDLLSLVGRVADVARPLPVHIDPIYRRHTALPELDMTGFNVVVQDGSYSEVRLDVEREFHWQLLKAHLGHDKAYTYLGHWKTAVLDELNTRITLMDRITQVLTQDLGITVDPSAQQPGHVSPLCVYEIAKALFGRALRESPPYKLEVTIVEAGELFMNNQLCGQLRDSNTMVLAEIRNLPEKLAKEDASASTLELHRMATEQAERARQAFLEIRASYYLPGKCASCGRYGL